MQFIVSSENKIFKGIIVGILSTFTFTSLLMALLSLVMVYTGVIESEYIEYAILGILAFSSFFGSYIALRISKKKGMMTGSIVGISVLIILLALGLFNERESLSVYSLLKAIATIFPSIIGGIVGVNYSKKLKL
ncbi:MAG: TIGR04086 family membrane protein [Acutalibacteraceae bacterium]